MVWTWYSDPRGLSPFVGQRETGNRIWVAVAAAAHAQFLYPIPTGKIVLYKSTWSVQCPRASNRKGFTLVFRKTKRACHLPNCRGISWILLDDFNSGIVNTFVTLVDFIISLYWGSAWRDIVDGHEPPITSLIYRAEDKLLYFRTKIGRQITFLHSFSWTWGKCESTPSLVIITDFHSHRADKQLNEPLSLSSPPLLLHASVQRQLAPPNAVACPSTPAPAFNSRKSRWVVSLVWCLFKRAKSIRLLN